MEVTKESLKALSEEQLAEFLLYSTEVAFAATSMPRFWAKKNKNIFSVFIKLLMIEMAERFSPDKNNFLNRLDLINEAAEERLSKFNPEEVRTARKKALAHFDLNLNIQTSSKKIKEQLIKSWMNVALLKMAYNINTEPTQTKEEKTAFLLSCNSYADALRLIESKADEYRQST